VAIESEVLVHAATEATKTLGAAEHATAVVVARKGKMDLALQIALGSSTQVALLVAPILVFAGVLLGRELNLVFTPYEVMALGLATIVTVIITLDGEIALVRRGATSCSLWNDRGRCVLPGLTCRL
jgi:Ca2+:H+ antiporter